MRFLNLIQFEQRTFIINRMNRIKIISLDTSQSLNSFASLRTFYRQPSTARMFYPNHAFAEKTELIHVNINMKLSLIPLEQEQIIKKWFQKVFLK